MMAVIRLIWGGWRFWLSWFRSSSFSYINRDIFQRQFLGDVSSLVASNGTSYTCTAWMREMHSLFGGVDCLFFYDSLDLALHFGCGFSTENETFCRVRSAFSGCLPSNIDRDFYFVHFKSVNTKLSWVNIQKKRRVSRVRIIYFNQIKWGLVHYISMVFVFYLQHMYYDNQ